MPSNLKIHRPRPLTPADRAALYNRAFPDRPPLAVHTNRAGRTWVYGIWEIGNDYRSKNGYYGSYPPGYVARVQAMFPDMPMTRTLHLFSGPLNEPGIKLDRRIGVAPTICADAAHLPIQAGAIRFTMADPPYSLDDAWRYHAPLPNKKASLHELARVTRPGGHLAWLDIPKPMYRKTEWHPWGTIGILRSINHRGRFLFLFERV